MKGYFYGWYFKCQSDTQTLAVIPAVPGAVRDLTRSIQFIPEDNAWTVTFPKEMFFQKEEYITIGKNRFGKKGFRLEVHKPELDVKGRIGFGALMPLKYDIMGPFALIPFMECRHSVWSMRHPVNGEVNINGQKYSFENALGYWEGDRGRSFPKRYAWTQCIFSEGSLMLSVADIPLAGMHFTGTIGIVIYKGKEYRLATYLGARILQKSDGKIQVIQGKMELEVRLLEKQHYPLQAPSNGKMIRTIHESASCRAFYRFRINGHTLFDFETDRASFEYEY